MEELNRILEEVGKANPVANAIDKTIKEQIEERSGAVYRLIQRTIGTRNEIKKLEHQIESAKKSLEKSILLMEKAKVGDFSWIAQNKEQEKSEGQ